MEQFGLLSYRGSGNLGNEIQSIAAARFLPRVDRFLDQDYLNTTADLATPIFLIMNGWFMHHPENWPPGERIRPLFVSFHIANPAIAQPHHAAYYRQHEPIGCRDVATVELLHNMGVDAYLSGCLTLTLQNDAADRSDQIYLVDVPDALESLIPAQIRRNAVKTTHLVGLPANLQHRLPPRTQRKLLTWWYHHAPLLRSWKFRRARTLLDRYRRAQLVITSRLHCALPCVAFGVPVVVLRKNHRDPRWTGSERYLPVYTPENIDELDWDQIPVPNKPDTSALEARIRGAIQAYG